MFARTLQLRCRTAARQRTLYRPYNASSVLRKDETDKSSDAKPSDANELPKVEPPKEGDAPAAEADRAETPVEGEQPKQYSYPELTRDAALHKQKLSDPDRPFWQNPLHHNNPDMQKMFVEDFESEEEFEKHVHPAPPLDPPDGGVAAPPELHDLAEAILKLNMFEYNELANKIADHYGFNEGMLGPDVDGAGGDGGDDDDHEGGGDKKAEEKTAFDVKLVSFDAEAKIKIIKEVRGLVAGLGLKEAKALVESAPCSVLKGVSKETADAMKAKLEEVGAVIEIE